MSAYAHFFDLMEDVGFFEHIYEHLPEGFTAMFEIARVLEDENNALAKKLLPALKLQTATAFSSDRASMPLAESRPELETFVPTGEEYDARLIRNMQDVPRIYTYQFLLPEEIFLRKVADRTLWVPHAKEPTYLPVQPDRDDYSPDSRKQKVYILLDTSSSMGVKNRINLAKAIVYYFLKHNLRELGYISLRTFDIKIGDLHIAQDRESFHALMSFVMRVHTLGNGTAMANAITQAVNDIRALPQLVGTEILIITDGACTLDEKEMRKALGDTIKINTVKIGKTQLYASRTYIDDALAKDDSPKRRQFNNLRKNETRLLYELEQTNSPSAKHKIESSLKYIQGEISKQYATLSDEILSVFGHELERLSTVYITVDDIDSQAIFTIDDERYQELYNLFRQIEMDLLENFSLENLKKAALLNDHIALILKFTKNEEQKKRLTELEKSIQNLLKMSVDQHLHSIDSSLMSSFSLEDRHDIQFLLEQSIRMNMSLWRLLLWKMITRIQRILKLRRSSYPGL